MSPAVLLATRESLTAKIVLAERDAQRYAALLEGALAHVKELKRTLEEVKQHASV